MCEKPQIGLGLAALGRPAYINIGHAVDYEQGHDVQSMRERAFAVLDAAWRAGVRYFDAARSYGAAEEFLGGWLRARELTPEQVKVGSKWGYIYTADWQLDAAVHERKDLSAANFARQREQTLAHLGPWLTTYQIHSATLASGVLEDRALLAALAEFKTATGVRVGLSVSGPAQGETILRALATGQFDTVQASWNALEQSAAGALAQAHAAGLTVIVKEVLANGRLSDRGDGPGLAALRAEAERQQAATGVRLGPDAVALALALQQPWADIVLSGATTAAMLQANLQALAVTPSEQLRAALPALAQEPERYWATRAELAWN